MSKTKSWLLAARLRTLPLSFSGIIAGSAMAVQHEVFQWPIFILALLTTLGFQVLSNFANDYGDGVKGTDNEERIGPKRAMQSGLLTPKELKSGMAVTTLLTLTAAGALIYVAFGKENFAYTLLFVVFGIAAIVAAIKYTVGKNAYGYRAMGDLFVFLFFGLLGVVGSYFLYAKALYILVFFPAITIGLLSVAVLHLNNMRDRISDTASGKKTVAVLLGAEKSKKYHFILLATAYFFAFSYGYVQEGGLLRFLPLLAFIPVLVHVKKVLKINAPEAFDPELKKIAISAFLYALLFFGSAFL